MQIASFKDMYIAELQELASMERQMGEALLRMHGVASHPSLKEALQRHREQARAQMDRLEQRPPPDLPPGPAPLRLVKSE